jgi:hypothetical protein
MLGRTLVILGGMIALIGVVFWAGERFFGRGGGFLPGDLVYRKGNFTFAFPIVTCIVLSLLLTFLMRLFGGTGGPR